MPARSHGPRERTPRYRPALLCGMALALAAAGCGGGADRDVRHHEQGLIYLNKTRDYPKAAEEFEAALKANPDRQETRYLLGRAYLLAREYDKALKTFADLQKRDKDDMRAVDGFCEAHTHRALRALGEWREYSDFARFKPVIRDLETAADYAEQYASKRPDEPRGYLLQADVARHMASAHFSAREYLARDARRARDLGRTDDARALAEQADKEHERGVARSDRATDLYDKVTRIDNKNLLAYERLIEGAFMQHSPDRAESAAQRLLAVQPDADIALLTLSRAAFVKGNVDEAMGYARKVLEKKPKHVDANAEMAKCALTQGRFDDAIDYANKVLKVNRKHAWALYWRGMAAIRKRDYPLTVDSLQPLAQTHQPNNLDATRRAHLFVCLAEAYRGQNDVQSAIGAFHKALQWDPDSGEAMLGLGELHLREGRIDAVRDVIDGIDKKTHGAYYNYLLGKLYIYESQEKWREGQDEAFKALALKADECFRKAEDLKPDSSFAHERKVTRLMLTGKFTDCIEACDKILDREPSRVGFRIVKARAQALLGRLGDAMRTARRNLEINSDNEATRVFIIDAYARYGRLDLAIREAERAAAILPKSVVIQRQLAVLHLSRARQGGDSEIDDLKACLVACGHVLDKSTSDVHILTVAAEANSRLGNQAEADRLLDQAVQARSNLASLHFMRGRAAMLRGRLDDARSAFKQALTLDRTQYGSIYPLAMVMITQGKPDDAVKLVKPATVVHGYEARHYVALVVAMHMAGRIDEAITLAQGAAAAVGASQPLDDVSLMLHLAAGKPDDARAALAARAERRAGAGAPMDPADLRHLRTLIDTVKDDARRARVLAREANVCTLYAVGGWPDAAIGAARRALKQAPDSIARKQALMVALTLAGRKHHDEALDLAKAISAADPEWPRGHVILASQFTRGGREDDAIREYERAVQLAPANPSLRFRLGAAYEAKGKKGKALDQYKAAAGIDTLENNPVLAYHIYNNLAYTLATHAGDVPAAMAVVEKAKALADRHERLVRNRTLHGNTLDTIGWVEHLAGRHDDALTTLERAHIYEPFSAIITYHLGAAALSAGKKDEAKRYLAAAIDLAPASGFDGLEKARELLAKL